MESGTGKGIEPSPVPVLSPRQLKQAVPRSFFLEATIEQFSTEASLPVLTISEPHRIFTNNEYTYRVAVRLLEYLDDMDNLRGTGRLFLP